MLESLENNSAYLHAFRVKDERVMGQLYAKAKKKFQKKLAFSYNYLPSYYLDDVYQDAFIQLGENIVSGKITEETLTVPIGEYLYGIGQNIAKEYVRNYDIVNEKEEQEVTVKAGPNKKPLLQPEYLPYLPPDEDNRFSDSDRRMIRHYVNEMQEPCASILTQFYFDEYTTYGIAILQGYKNEDTAKTRKYKCFKKLQNAIKHHLHGYFDFEI